MLFRSKGTGLGAISLNGVDVRILYWGVLTPLTTGDLWLSRRPNDLPGDWTFNSFFVGLLDEVAIYDRALSAAELQAICLEENHGEPLNPPPTTPPGRGSGAVPDGVR